MFATIALLGYVFNFSVLYSNFALEAIYTIVVLNRRIDQILIEAIKYQEENTPKPVKSKVGEVSIKFDTVTSVWSPTMHAKGAKPPIQGISFEIEGPKKVAVIGRVGSGKTTLLQTLLQEAFITDGSVEISGQPTIAE